ncbi:MAG: hypothetical protein ACFFEX_18225 [Candidatus Thorarchaeota archaeon]
MIREFVSIGALLFLFLLPVPAKALSAEANLGFGEVYGLYRNANAGWRVEGSFTAVNAIEFFICDAGNYSKWINNQAAVLFDHNEQTTVHNFNFTIHYDSVWYVIFSNSYAAGNISLDAEIRFIDQLGVEQTQVNEITHNLISAPLVIGFLAAGMGISILGVWWARRREPRPAVRYDEILSKPN